MLEPIIKDEVGSGGQITWALESDRFRFEYWQCNFWSPWPWKNYLTPLSTQFNNIKKLIILFRHKLPSSVTELCCG